MKKFCYGWAIRLEKLFRWILAQWILHEKICWIYVEVDLRRPLIPKLQVLGHVQVVEYEGLHLVCCSCGQYGHKAQDCPLLMSTPRLGQTTRDTGLQQQLPRTTHVLIEPEATFGPWVLVQNCRRH